MKSKQISNATKAEIKNLFKKESEEPTSFVDKLRLLILMILCQVDIQDIK
jgi:hypothetical protein